LVLRAPVGTRLRAPARARLPRLSRAHRASLGDRLWGLLLALWPERGQIDGAWLDRVLRGTRRRRLPAGPVVLRAGRGSARRTARVEPLLRREPSRPGLSRHLLRRARRVGHSARDRAPTARAARVPAAGSGRPAAPRRVALERYLLAVVYRKSHPPGRQPYAPALPRLGGDRTRSLDRFGRGRDGQSALLAALDLGPGRGTRPHREILRSALLDLVLCRAHRQAAGRARQHRRGLDRDLARAAPRTGSTRGARQPVVRVCC